MYDTDTVLYDLSFTVDVLGKSVTTGLSVTIDTFGTTVDSGQTKEAFIENLFNPGTETDDIGHCSTFINQY